MVATRTVLPLLTRSQAALSSSTATSPLSSSLPRSSYSATISTPSGSTPLAASPFTPNEKSSSTDSGSDQPSTIPSTTYSSSSVPSRSSSSAQSPTNGIAHTTSDSGNNLNKADTIALAVVVPSVGVIVAVIFGVREWNRKHSP